MFRTCNAFSDQHAHCWMILLLSIFPLNSFCSTLVNDHREYFIWLLLPYFSDDKTIYFFFSEALASSCPQFSLYEPRFDFVSILQNGEMFEKLGDFFLFICPSLYRLETCSLFFLLFMLSLWNDLIDNWTIANKFTQFIWISTYFFSVFSWSYLWFYWMFLKQNERVLLRWQTLFFRCCYF